MVFSDCVDIDPFIAYGSITVYYRPLIGDVNSVVPDIIIAIMTGLLTWDTLSHKGINEPLKTSTKGYYNMLKRMICRGIVYGIISGLISSQVLETNEKWFLKHVNKNRLPDVFFCQSQWHPRSFESFPSIEAAVLERCAK